MTGLRDHFLDLNPHPQYRVVERGFRSVPIDNKEFVVIAPTPNADVVYTCPVGRIARMHTSFVTYNPNAVSTTTTLYIGPNGSPNNNTTRWIVATALATALNSSFSGAVLAAGEEVRIKSTQPDVQAYMSITEYPDDIGLVKASGYFNSPTVADFYTCPAGKVAQIISPTFFHNLVGSTQTLTLVYRKDGVDHIVEKTAAGTSVTTLLSFGEQLAEDEKLLVGFTHATGANINALIKEWDA